MKAKQTLIRLSVLLLIFASTDSLLAQVKKGELLKGKSMRSQINPTEKHQYAVKLDEDQFAFFRLLQMAVDLKITTYDSEGKQIEDFDSTNRKYGPELFEVISSKKGIYTIEIALVDEAESSGNYELTLEILRPKATSQNELVDELFAPWDTNETPGAAVAIVKDGAVIYKKGYGLANLEYNIPITPSTVFHIASVSKQFTVFSILLLEKQGKLSLEDDIRKYIPEVPDFGKTITLRHLASHTSGLRDQWNLLSMAGWRMDDVITKEHVLKLVSKQKELNFNPGEEYAYCNTGFTLLAEVVSRLTGKSFAEFTKANIFEPLQMYHTLFYDDHEKIVKNRAYSYYADSSGIKKRRLNYANVGATSLFTTVEDLSLWSLNFSNIKVGDTTLLNTMNTPAILNDGKAIEGALGQFVGKYKGLNEISHGGADAGYRTYLTRFPDENFSVIVFSNSAEFSSGSMAHKVVDIYLKDKMEPKKEDAKKDDLSKDITVPQTILATYVGDFELQPGFIISVVEEGGKLSAQATGQSARPLTAMTTSEFKVGGVDAKIEFIPNEENDITYIKLHQGGQIIDAPRIEKFDKASVKFSDYSGQFYSEELSTTYNISLVEGKLTVQHRRLSDFNLNPTKKDEFSSDAWFFGRVVFMRNTNNLITGFKVSNGRVRNLYFEKIN